MESETKGLDALDPIARFAVLSLFPRTLGGLQTAPQPSDFEQDLDSIHDHVKSLASQNPKKLLGQAKAVMEENKQLNINAPSNAAQDNSELIVAADNNPKKRRLGLDRKRPRFSLKPDLSQPSVNLEPSFDIDDYEDPKEFFAAYARFEHIKKEIQKQTGTSQKDDVHFTSSQEERTRRPGLGRSYKHHFIESDILPQELLAKNTNAPSSADLQESVKLCTPSKKRDVNGSEKEVDKGNGLLNKLLSKDLEDLEGDGAINLIQKHLQMEDISIDNLCLPEMVSKKASFGNTIKPRRALSDIQNLSKGVLHSSDANPSGTVSFKGDLSSKNRPKSPHAQIAILKKRLFNANTSVDPFSSVYVDEVDAYSEDVNMSGNTFGKVRSPVTIADDNVSSEVGTFGATLEHSVHAHDDTLSHSFNQEHSHGAGSIHINGDLKNTLSGSDMDQTVRDDEMNIADSSLDVLGQEEATIPGDLDPNMENLNCKKNTITTDLEEAPVCSVIEEQPKDLSPKGANSAPEQQVVEATIPSESDPIMENLNCKENTITTDLEEPPVFSVIEEPKDGSSKDADSAPEQQVEEPTQSLPNGKRKGKLGTRKDNKRKGKLGTRKNNKRKAPSSDDNPEDILNPATVDCENSESANSCPEKPVEEAPRETTNEERKLEKRKQKQQRMEFDSLRRQSLSGVGTKWEKCKLKKGNEESEIVVRRGTRIRSRPLAFWKGERFLYGRVHESLTTVIGIKSFGSPGDNGEPSLKVKSFVDEKFNSLVEFAALY